MSRKRDRDGDIDRPYLTRQDRSPYPKRRRPLPPHQPLPFSSSSSSSASEDKDGGVIGKPFTKPHPPPAVVVMGFPPDCSVLDLKSRFEIYGAISRIRVVRDGVGYITYRSKDSAGAAVAAGLDPLFGITIDSKKVQVLWSTDPLAQWREGIGVGVGSKENGSTSSSSSKLVRAEVPLSRHGRGNNKLASAIVSPKASNESGSSSSGLDVPFKGREIVAYDDIL